MLIRTHQHSHRGTNPTRRRGSWSPFHHGTKVPFQPFHITCPSSENAFEAGWCVQSVRACCMCPLLFPAHRHEKQRPVFPRAIHRRIITPTHFVKKPIYTSVVTLALEFVTLTPSCLARAMMSTRFLEETLWAILWCLLAPSLSKLQLHAPLKLGSPCDRTSLVEIRRERTQRRRSCCASGAARHRWCC